MPDGNVLIESYDRVEFTTARGVTVIGRCLEVQGTARVLRLLEAVQKGDAGAQAALIEEFCELAELGKPRISLAELLDEVLPHFLSLKGPQATTSPASVPGSTGAT